VLREDKNGGFVYYRPEWWAFWRKPYWHYRTGRREFGPWTVPEKSAIDAYETQQPVPLMRIEARQYWAYRGRFWWEDDGYSAQDVMALVLDRERKKQRQLDRAYAMMNAPAAESKREGIPQDVKLAVWKAYDGRCANCGSTELLEFDHVVPLAMGGSNTVTNLQLLCADCNREKGGSLVEPRTGRRVEPRQAGGAPPPPPPPADSGALPPPPPGWHRDPTNEARLRYWDGSQWTDHTAQ
jgi:5-methylcytosine-specific restriction endonuclease McrA